MLVAVAVVCSNQGGYMVRLSPIATAVASNEEIAVLATFKERLCRPFCVDSTIQPQVSIVYTAGHAVLNESTVFVPITAVITIVTPCSKCNAKVQLFTEVFDVAFQGQTSLPKAVVIESKGRIKYGSDLKCGCAHSYTINDSLAIGIKPALKIAPFEKKD